MSQSGQEVKRTVVTSSQQRSYQTIQSNQLNTSGEANNSGTGYQANIQITTSNIMPSRKMIPGSNTTEINLIGRRKEQNQVSGPQLEWSQYEDKLIVNGDTDFVALKNMKSVMLELINQFKARDGIDFRGDYRQNFEKRLILLEHDFEGLMRRVLNLKFMHPTDSKRNIDYSKFITEKENLVIDLERKLFNLQEKNKPFEEKITQLEIENNALKKELISKNNYIQDLSRQLEQGLLNSKATGRFDSIQSHIASLEKQIENLKSKNANMEALQTMIEGWISGLPRGSLLQRKLESGTLRMKEDELYLSMLEKLRYAQDMFSFEMRELEKNNPGVTLPAKSKILEILGANNTKVSRVNAANGVIEIEKETRIEREVPVQDARTKALITSLGRYVKKLITKYPKLKADLDVQIQEYLSNDLLDVIVNDDLDKIISITKYVPQTVKVENVYSYSSEKNKKVQFYLRVLIKALLEQFQKIKAQIGVDLDIDEGVIGMIKAELVDLVDIDAILALFRSVPKVVQVPKYVEKVVDSIVTIPERYVVKQKTAQVVPMNKTEVVVDKVGVPIKHEIPVEMVREVAVKAIDTIEKPVIHTQYRDVPVNQVIERSKAVEVPTKHEVICEQDRVVQVPGEDNIIIQKEMEIVEVPRTETRYLQTVKEVMQPVEHAVEKIVERLIERERPVAVPVLQQKLVKEVVYEVVKENNPVYITKYEVAKEIQEKVVEVVQTRDQIQAVDRIIEKVVPVQRIVELPPKEIQVKEQVMAVQEVAKIIEVPRTEYVPTREEVPVEIVKEIERPLFVEVVKVEKEINNVPFINEIVKEVHIPVQISKPVIVAQEFPVEVPTTVPHYIKEEVPVFVKEEKTISVPFYYDRIKPEVQTIEKIVEKIVEVPRTEIIQKIVQKIVVVPRIVQKIVEVPQIIQKIVEKIVEVPKELPPIERIVEKPCIVEVPVEVPVEKIVYLIVQKEKIVKEEVLVKDLETKTINVPQEIINERIVVQTKERPVQVFKDRIEYLHIEDIKVVDNDRVVVHPVQVPVPIVLEKQLPVYITNEVTHVMPVPHVVEKIIPQIEERVIVEPVEVVKTVPYIQDQVKEVVKEKVIVQTKYEQVKVIEEKIVDVVHEIERIKEVPVMYEQLVPLIFQKAKTYQFNNDYQVVQAPPKIEIIEKVKPYIVNVNKYIERIVQKLVEVPYLIKETNVQELVQETVVPGPQRHTKDTEVVEMSVEKELYREVEKKVIDTVHRIDEVLKTATEIIERDRDPVIITKDKIIEVPYVLEKIVEKITMMPQIVEVLKHVYQIAEEDQLNVLVDLDVEVRQYQEMAGALDRQMVGFLDELKKIKTSQPHLSGRVDFLQKYMAQFKRYIKHPKILERIKEVKVEPEKEIVRVPRQKTAEEAKDELAKVLLIEQLLSALRKIGAENRNINLDNYLEQEVMAMFDLSFTGSVSKVSSNFNSQLKKFQNSIEGKFSKLAGWGTDHNVMLKSFIDERFQLANVIKRTKEINQQLTKENNELRQKLERERDVPVKIIQLLIEFNQFMPSILSVLDKERHRQLYDSYSKLLKKFQNFKKLYDSIIVDSHFARTSQLDEEFIEKYKGSCLREFVTEIAMLKDKVKTSRWRDNEHAACEATIQKLKLQITRLQALLRQARVRGGMTEKDINSRTNVSPNYRRPEQYNISSQSDVEAYGANFGDYVESDPNGAGLIYSRKQYFPSYGSNVEGARELAGSAATYRSNQVVNSLGGVNSAQYIKVEGSSGKISMGTSEGYGEGGYGSSNNLGVRQGESRYVGQNQGGSTYSNNVQITTSRITTGGGQISSGQAVIRQPEVTYGSREGAMSSSSATSGANRYQFYQKKYEKTRGGV